MFFAGVFKKPVPAGLLCLCSLWRYDRVLHRFRDAKLHDFFGRDLNGLASRGITARARLPLLTNEAADAGDHEHALLLCLTNGHLGERFDELLCALCVHAAGFGKFLDDLRLRHSSVCHKLL